MASQTPPARSTYDLHLHTYWSYDATAQPEHYFRVATQTGVRCLAVTEHHVLDSQAELARIAPAYPSVRLIPAAELSVHTFIGAVDLLCYGFARGRSQDLQRVLAMYHQWQRDYGEAICRGMQALGCEYTDEDRRGLLQSYRPARTLAVQGNTHAQNEIQRGHFLSRGFIRNEDEYVPLLGRIRREVGLPNYPDVGEVVPVLRREGVLVVIAHPAAYFTGKDLTRMDLLREQCQLDGIECAHPSIPPALTPFYREYCVQRGLLSTAGSDCHSNEDVERMLGQHGGEQRWCDELLKRLETR